MTEPLIADDSLSCFALMASIASELEQPGQRVTAHDLSWVPDLVARYGLKLIRT
jgi:hypothetical protein